ncbi:hypothetical protein BT67DRAFT_484264 [Trichocladium antarcticum]|uniref:Uncharacterized protein n=1 Tax=Trichocladium antarcticum TaxID=1450529 RepID=A0AAN6URP3_9PEZI|nr:hypothetical protein BT67DRAFT_484264 [Trichocladium antarcticum]
MSAHSSSPSPRQVAANGETDESKMPKGHCRYILLLPEIRGQRCACVRFSLNRGIPGASCECGHLACFHNEEPEATTDQRHDLEQLKKRIQNLEHQLSRGQENVLDGVIRRLHEAEEHLEKSTEEFSEQIKGAYRNVSLTWRSIEQAERKSQQQDEQLREVYGKLRNHDEQLDRVHAGQLELRDADLSLEERIENLTETLEEEEEWRLVTASRRPWRRSTSATPGPALPLGPLGLGAVPSPTHLRPRAGGPGGKQHPPHHPHHRARKEPSAIPGSARTRRPRGGPATATGAWTVHISLLPHASVPMPFERNTNAYQRCLSRGLHRTVAVQGPSAADFRAAVDSAFGQFLRFPTGGKETTTTTTTTAAMKAMGWMPLQAKLCDAETLQGLPMLRQLDRVPAETEVGHVFLRDHCAVVDASGVIDSLYIALCPPRTLSWHVLRRSPVYMEGLEGCWKYDPLLDGKDPPLDDGGGRGMGGGLDDERRPAAGDIAGVVAAGPMPMPGRKRPLSEMTRSGSFGAAGVVGAAGATSVPAGDGGGGGDEARVKRVCPAVPASGPIVEIRRRDIKTA